MGGSSSRILTEQKTSDFIVVEYPNDYSTKIYKTPFIFTSSVMQFSRSNSSISGKISNQITCSEGDSSRTVNSSRTASIDIITNTHL